LHGLALSSSLGSTKRRSTPALDWRLTSSDFPGLKTVDGIAETEEFKGAWFKDPDENIIAVG
jgi:hypothetical protein